MINFDNNRAEAEMMVLSCIMLEPHLIQTCVLHDKHFHDVRNKNIIAAFRSLEDKGVPLELKTFTIEMNSNMESVGGFEYINQVFNQMPTTTHFEYYQSVVMEQYNKRVLIKSANQLLNAAQDGESYLDLLRIARTFEDEVEDVGEKEGSIKSSLIKLLESCESGEILDMIKTHFSELDKLIKGYRPRNFIVVGARPSIGKTAYALQTMVNVSEDKDVITAIFSLEMSKDEILLRLVSNISGIPSNRLLSERGSLTEKEWERFTYAIGRLDRENIKIFDNHADIEKIRRACRNLRFENPDKKIFVVVDYLQLVATKSKRKDMNRTQEVGQISRMLKRIAYENEISIMALSQLNRSVESRQDKRPLMSDLREAGDIEQDADIVQLLYREDYYQKSEATPILEVIVAKQRNGDLGTIPLLFKKVTGRFYNVDNIHGGT